MSTLLGAVQTIPVKELVIARNNTFEQLLSLRRKVIASMNTLARHQFAGDFLGEVEEYVARELVPDLKLYYSKFWDILPKFLGLVPTLTCTSAALGLTQSLAPKAVALLTGISAVVGTAASTLSDFIMKSGKNSFRNTYCYFLNFRDRT